MDKELEDLLQAIIAYNKAAAGDSGDEEHDRANDMRDAAISFMRWVAIMRVISENNTTMTDLIGTYQEQLDKDWSEDQEG